MTPADPQILLKVQNLFVQVKCFDPLTILEFQDELTKPEEEKAQDGVKIWSTAQGVLAEASTVLTKGMENYFSNTFSDLLI